MKDIVIIGAGGLGREVYDTILLINDRRPTYNLIGFYDDTPEFWGKTINGLKCIGGIESINNLLEPQKIFAVIAIANAVAKKEISSKLEDIVEWENIIHPEAYISKYAKIGNGNIFQRQSTLNPNVSIGNHCLINGYSGLGHDASLGDFSSVMSQCDITGGVKLGKSVYMGTGSRIVPGVAIGDSVFICAGAVVFKSVGSGRKVLGNPGKEVG